MSRLLDNSNWSSGFAEAPKRYADVRDQMASRLQRTEFTLPQHKAFFDQMRRGESLYVQAED
jgi:hypothetical protein